MLYDGAMNAGMKFTLGAVLIVGAVGYLMASGVRQTGQYFLTPSELSQKLAADPTFYDVGMRVGARVVPGSVTRVVEGRLQHDGVIHATDVLAKCGSRYESVPKA